MANKNIFLLIGILFLILPDISAVIINEIMYNPTTSLGGSNGEWIELYNPSSEDINITGWKIADPSNHLITEGNLIVPASGYLVIVKSAFFSNFPNYYNVTNFGKAGFGLNNGGEEIKLIDSAEILIDSITYNPNMGANGDGNSLQLCGSSFSGKSPTPGSANSCSTNQTQTANNQTITANGTTTPTAEVSNPSIGVNYPEKAVLNQEFIFKIKLINFDEDIYDVKIDILSNENRISEILNENLWKSTSYYVNNALSQNQEKEFLMKITKEFESAEITIKIKDSSEKTKIFSGYLISKSNEIINETEEEYAYQNSAEDSKLNETETIIIIGSATANAKDIKSEENTKKLNKNDYAKYILSAFAFLLALLFLLKKKIFKKEYKNEFQKQEFENK